MKADKLLMAGFIMFLLLAAISSSNPPPGTANLKTHMQNLLREGEVATTRDLNFDNLIFAWPPTKAGEIMLYHKLEDGSQISTLTLPNVINEGKDNKQLQKGALLDYVQLFMNGKGFGQSRYFETYKNKNIYVTSDGPTEDTIKLKSQSLHDFVDFFALQPYAEYSNLHIWNSMEKNELEPKPSLGLYRKNEDKIVGILKNQDMEKDLLRNFATKNEDKFSHPCHLQGYSEEGEDYSLKFECIESTEMSIKDIFVFQGVIEEGPLIGRDSRGKLIFELLSSGEDKSFPIAGKIKMLPEIKLLPANAKGNMIEYNKGEDYVHIKADSLRFFSVERKGQPTRTSKCGARVRNYDYCYRTFLAYGVPARESETCGWATAEDLEVKIVKKNDKLQEIDYARFTVDFKPPSQENQDESECETYLQNSNIGGNYIFEYDGKVYEYSKVKDGAILLFDPENDMFGVTEGEFAVTNAEDGSGICKIGSEFTPGFREQPLRFSDEGCSLTIIGEGMSYDYNGLVEVTATDGDVAFFDNKEEYQAYLKDKAPNGPAMLVIEGATPGEYTIESKGILQYRVGDTLVNVDPNEPATGTSMIINENTGTELLFVRDGRVDVWKGKTHFEVISRQGPDGCAVTLNPYKPSPTSIPPLSILGKDSDTTLLVAGGGTESCLPDEEPEQFFSINPEGDILAIDSDSAAAMLSQESSEDINSINDLGTPNLRAQGMIIVIDQLIMIKEGLAHSYGVAIAPDSASTDSSLSWYYNQLVSSEFIEYGFWSLADMADILINFCQNRGTGQCQYGVPCAIRAILPGTTIGQCLEETNRNQFGPYIYSTIWALKNLKKKLEMGEDSNTALGQYRDGFEVVLEGETESKKMPGTVPLTYEMLSKVGIDGKLSVDDAKNLALRAKDEGLASAHALTFDFIKNDYLSQYYLLMDIAITMNKLKPITSSAGGFPITRSADFTMEGDQTLSWLLHTKSLLSPEKRVPSGERIAIDQIFHISSSKDIMNIMKTIQNVKQKCEGARAVPTDVDDPLFLEKADDALYGPNSEQWIANVEDDRRRRLSQFHGIGSPYAECFYLNSYRAGDYSSPVIDSGVTLRVDNSGLYEPGYLNLAIAGEKGLQILMYMRTEYDQLVAMESVDPSLASLSQAYNQAFQDQQLEGLKDFFAQWIDPFLVFDAAFQLAKWGVRGLSAGWRTMRTMRASRGVESLHDMAIYRATPSREAASELGEGAGQRIDDLISDMDNMPQAGAATTASSARRLERYTNMKSVVEDIRAGTFQGHQVRETEHLPLPNGQTVDVYYIRNTDIPGGENIYYGVNGASLNSDRAIIILVDEGTANWQKLARWAKAHEYRHARDTAMGLRPGAQMSELRAYVAMTENLGERESLEVFESLLNDQFIKIGTNNAEPHRAALDQLSMMFLRDVRGMPIDEIHNIAIADRMEIASIEFQVLRAENPTALAQQISDLTNSILTRTGGV